MVSDQVDSGQVGGCEGSVGLDLCACLLREHGIRVTSQRTRILCFLRDRDDHPTADSIFTALKPEEPSLSRTTVYNTLDLLNRAGLVSVLTISAGEQHYEFGQDMHHHLLCDTCGRIMDIEIKCPYTDGLLHGRHKIKEVHGYFRGTCDHCLSGGAEDTGSEE